MDSAVIFGCSVRRKSRSFASGVPLGRVEHVGSGKRTRFNALEELREFMARTLLEEQAGSAGPADDRRRL